ncbi:hypothetical protein Hanom_Chr10g00934461 [Helianthus anomalus]
MYSLKLTIYIYVYCQILNYTHMYIVNFKVYICVYYEKLRKNVWFRMLLKFLNLPSASHMILTLYIYIYIYREPLK